MIACREHAGMMLRVFFLSIYVPRRLPARNPNTIRLYEYCFARLATFLGREPIVADLRDESILIAFLEDYGAGRSAVSRNKFKNHLAALAGLAHKRGLIRTVPELPDLAEPRRIPESLPPATVARLVAVCGGSPGFVCGLPSPLYWAALFLTAIATGLRAGALFALRRRDVDLPGRSVLATAETQKQNADQRLRIPPIAVAAIRAIWLPDRELLFPWNRHPTTRYHYLRKLTRAAGLPDDRRHKLQALRRTCATWTKKYGGDATAQLGHSSDAVTRASYLDPTEDRQAADVIPWELLLPPDDPPADFSI